MVEKIVHPSYPGPNGIAHDVALLRVDPPFDLNGDTVNVVCMPEMGAPVPLDQNCYVAGWGTLESGGDSPDVLNSVDVTVYSDEVCASKLSFDNYF